jgi:hypothetical protein
MEEIEIKEKFARFDRAKKKVDVTVSKIGARKQSYIIKEDGQEINHGEGNFIDLAACLKDIIEKWLPTIYRNSKGWKCILS